MSRFTRSTELPAELDVAFYRAHNEDLAALDDAALAAHFADWGEVEGRVGAAPATREGFLADVLQRQTGDILEVGPFCRPLLTGSNVYYLDILDAAALRSRAVREGLDPSGCPERIHFVGDIATVRQTFSAIVSSHSIEHQPDLVHHLRTVAKLLKPKGRYFLIIPDKRYCFDAFVPESTIASVMQAHHEQRRTHTLQSVIEHRALSVHNDGPMHWQGIHGEAKPANQETRITKAIAEYQAAKGGYVDVHAWYLYPAVFRRITEALFNLGLTGLAPLRVYNTPRNRFEFCAVLEKR